MMYRKRRETTGQGDRVFWNKPSNLIQSSRSPIVQSAEAHDALYTLDDPTPEQRALADAAVNSALRLQPDLPEVHLAYAVHLYLVIVIMNGHAYNSLSPGAACRMTSEAIMLEARMDRRQGNSKKQSRSSTKRSREIHAMQFRYRS